MRGGSLGTWLVASATAVVILGASILPFTTPAYVRFEQARTGVGGMSHYSAQELDDITNQILADLFLWRGDFDIGDADLLAVLNDRERSHMRDVRGVFAGFELLVLASLALLVVTFRRGRGMEARAAAWRGVARGARGLAISLAVIGAFALLAFDAAFELFHRLFFSSGTYTFDPRTDRLVQLFPLQFWSDTAIAVGVVAMVVALATAWLASRRAGTAQAAPALVTSRVQT